MSWIKTSKKIICRLILVRGNSGAEVDEAECEEMLKREIIDWIYFWLGAFTYLYLAVLALFFFGRLGGNYPSVLLLIDVLQGPYLGALGVYVILKEIRKRQRYYPSLYRGEFFVVLWTLILFFSTAAAVFSPDYEFDGLYKIIFANSLTALIIYFGSIINKP